MSLLSRQDVTRCFSGVAVVTGSLLQVFLRRGKGSLPLIICLASFFFLPMGSVKAQSNAWLHTCLTIREIHTVDQYDDNSQPDFYAQVEIGFKKYKPVTDSNQWKNQSDISPDWTVCHTHDHPVSIVGWGQLIVLDIRDFDPNSKDEQADITQHESRRDHTMVVYFAQNAGDPHCTLYNGAYSIMTHPRVDGTCLANFTTRGTDSPTAYVVLEIRSWYTSQK